MAITLAISLLLWLLPAQGAETPLRLLRALPIEGLDNLEPSGLSWCDNRLLMVSDNHNHQVFELQTEDETARVTSYRRIRQLPAPDLEAYPADVPRLTGHWDWEGLACEGDHLYLLSETLAQVLKLDPHGQGQWLGASLYRAGRKQGLFAQHNAFAEGLALDSDRVYIAAERHPRGLVVASREEEPWPSAWALPLNPFPDLFQPHDFSGLWTEGGALYTLERNHFRICRRRGEAFTVETCWSYRHVEQDPALAYRDQRFGKAEGVARHGDLLYLVLDNNGGARQTNPRDLRPWLFILERPQDW